MIGKVISAFLKRPNSRINGNSSYSAERIQAVYGCDAGFIHPSVDFSEFTLKLLKKKIKHGLNLMNYQTHLG